MRNDTQIHYTYMLTYPVGLDLSFHFVCRQGRLLRDFVLAQAGQRAVRALAACMCDRYQNISCVG